jgi:CrcB protein
MRALLLVGSGGFLGAVARYALSRLIGPEAGVTRFPVGTLVVNVSGCLAIGLLSGFSERAGVLSADARLFLMTGLIGGFTTFSAFALETYALRGQTGLAILNVIAQVGLGLLAVVAGVRWATGS